MRRLATTLLPLVCAAAILAYGGPGHLWARNHLGDCLVVAFLVGALAFVRPWSFGRRASLVALVAAAVEIGQLASGASGRNDAMQLLIGAHFDPLDFAYYGLGIALAYGLEWVPCTSGRPRGAHRGG